MVELDALFVDELVAAALFVVELVALFVGELVAFFVGELDTLFVVVACGVFGRAPVWLLLLRLSLWRLLPVVCCYVLFVVVACGVFGRAPV